MMEKQNNSKGDNNTPKTTEKKATDTQVAELQKQNEKLLKRLQELEKSNKPKNLLEQIKFVEEQKSLIEKMKSLNGTKDFLVQAKEKVNQPAEENDFSKMDYSLTFSEFHEYSRGQEFFKISNPVVIQSALEHLIKVIDTRVSDLKNQIAEA